MEDTEENLLQLVQTYDLKRLKNKQEISALWNVVTQVFNKATDGENSTKKQLQKRLSYITYKEKTKESADPAEEEETPIKLQEQIERSLKASQIADQIEESVEKIISERLKIQAQIKALNG